MLISATRERALARVGKALADPTRRRLLLGILDGVAYPAELAERLELSRANVSNHLACLRDCGLVTATYEGRHVRYEIADPHLSRALTELTDVILAVFPSDTCLNGADDVPCDGCDCDHAPARPTAVTVTR